MVKKRIVVSITTIPQRVKLLDATLTSLMNQTIVPDKIYLNVPTDRDFDWNLLKKLKEKFSILEINPVPKDLGPITKLIPTLDKEPDDDTYLILADDDMIYPKTTIASLTSDEYDDYPAVGFSGRNLDLMFYHDVPKANVYLLETYAGVRYKRWIFPGSEEFTKWVDSQLKIEPECFYTDDIVIAKWVNKFTSPKMIRVDEKSYVINTEDTPTLSSQNLGNNLWNGRNGKCMRAIVGEKGIINSLKNVYEGFKNRSIYSLNKKGLSIFFLILCAIGLYYVFSRKKKRR